MRLDKYISFILALMFTLAIVAAPISGPLAAEETPTVDSVIESTYAVNAAGDSAIVQTPASTGGRSNYYPIVMVGGMSCWGRDEMLGFKYFGGFTDVQTKMCNAGYTTYTAAPGPFSSYYDRA
ncbi:MAG: hypothetical protein ACM3UZ_11550, partial [Acidobacteriota bacterium]